MAWALFLLTLLTFCLGAHSQPTLTQPPSQSVSPGQTVKLPCTINSDSNNIYWYQQKHTNPPRYVHCDGCSRGDGIPDRFTGSRSGNVGSLPIGSLTITNTQPEDEAVYYCAMWYRSGSQFIFGGGTTLVVSGQPVVAPLVVVYPPSQEEMEKKNKATVVCLLSNFHPPTFTLSWEADGTPITTGVETTKATKVNDKYVASSYLTLSPSEWKSRGSYTCKVTHEGGPNEKSVSHSQCP